MSHPTKSNGEPLIRILHPSDFSKASRGAFAHALKIALQSKAELEIVHVEQHKVGSDRDVHWTEFNGVVLPGGGRLYWRKTKLEEVAKPTCE